LPPFGGEVGVAERNLVLTRFESLDLGPNPAVFLALTLNV